MVSVKPIGLPLFSEHDIKSYRLINSNFPPINLFDDVASADEFEALYTLQSITNPRLQNEIGNLNLLPVEDIPFGITGCHYAAAAFTHINPNGSRFSDGSFGLLYVASCPATAIAEVEYHQNLYWRGIPGLKYDRFVFRLLCCFFDVNEGVDATSLPLSDSIYDSDSYASSRDFGNTLKQTGIPALRYHSVRHAGGVCHALFTPKEVKKVTQTTHYEMIWDGKKISSTSIISQPR